MSVKAFSNIVTVLVTVLILLYASFSLFGMQPLKAVGNIYIRADGSVDPSAVPIYRDGLVYVIESDLYNSIVVEKDNIVVDGAGHFINGVGNGVGIHLPNVKNVTIKGFKIQEFSVGVLMEKSFCCRIFENSISLCNDGIVLVFSSNNNICENSIMSNYGDGIESSDIGVLLFRSSNNHIFHNNFFNNTFQAHAHADSRNIWDNGYPYGGNYWEGHNAPDENLDRLGDVQYVINGENIDNYPLVYPFEFYKPDHNAKPDVNKDGVLNIFDLYVIANAYGCKPGDYRWNPWADLDMNGIINVIDLYKVIKSFMK